MEEKGKRGRPSKEKTIEVIVDTDSNVDPVVQIKQFAKRIIDLDELITQEPYRMDLRFEKKDILDKMCYLVLAKM
jgi:hypothetical protein